MPSASLSESGRVTIGPISLVHSPLLMRRSASRGATSAVSGVRCSGSAGSSLFELVAVRSRASSPVGSESNATTSFAATKALTSSPSTSLPMPSR